MYEIATLGERIRSYRKKKKMTLEALAGDTLTKGMLSLIENNKANPSMESLRFIAERLGVEVSDLLEEVSALELMEVLEEAEKLYYTDIEQVNDEYKQLIKLVKPYVGKLTQGYESARLLEMYSKCLFLEKENGWQQYADLAAHMYEQMNITSKRADIGLFRANVKYRERDYRQALNILLHERAEIEENNILIEPMTRVDLDYHEAVLYFAVGDSDLAIQVMENAIAYSKDQRIFYRIDDLYRMAAFHALMFQNEDKLIYYVEKLKLYGEFADDNHSILFYHIVGIEISIAEGKYTYALKELDTFLSSSMMNEIFMPYFLIAKAKALYGLKRYREAIDVLDDVKISSFLHHPFDLSYFYTKESYRALCLMNLGNLEEARIFASIALDNITPLPYTPYKDFINETFALIKEKAE